MNKITMALLTVSSLGIMASAQGLPSQGTANVYFLDTTGYGAVSVWVDGQKVIQSSFVDTPTMNGRPIAVGKHRVVVTPFYARPGEKDIASGIINFPSAGTYTLRVGNVGNPTYNYGFKTPTLYTIVGAPS